MLLFFFFFGLLAVQLSLIILDNCVFMHPFDVYHVWYLYVVQLIEHLARGHGPSCVTVPTVSDTARHSRVTAIYDNSVELCQWIQR
jgi:hypothetical protein